MNALSLIRLRRTSKACAPKEHLSLRAKKNQCRKISHTQSRSHTDFAPLTYERCSYNAMIEYVTIRKLKG
jgi:hypothetical protein